MQHAFWPTHQHSSSPVNFVNNIAHGACRYIDGRVWPEDDELEVRLMMDLIGHVTGGYQRKSSAPSLLSYMAGMHH